MLFGRPTKNGTGIELSGDYYDLKSLYKTIHMAADALNEYQENLNGQFKLLMNFGYEIRKAYEGSREVLVLSENEIKYTYYGVKIIWTDVILFSATLRHNIGYIKSNQESQGIIYLLENAINMALDYYDPIGASKIGAILEGRINVSDKYLFLIYQALHYDFISLKLGKTRFRKIPELILSYFEHSNEKRIEFVESLKRSADNFKCNILDIEIETEFPIIW